MGGNKMSEERQKFKVTLEDGKIIKGIFQNESTFGKNLKVYIDGKGKYSVGSKDEIGVLISGVFGKKIKGNVTFTKAGVFF